MPYPLSCPSHAPSYLTPRTLDHADLGHSFRGRDQLRNHAVEWGRVIQPDPIRGGVQKLFPPICAAPWGLEIRFRPDIDNASDRAEPNDWSCLQADGYRQRAFSVVGSQLVAQVYIKLRQDPSGRQRNASRPGAEVPRSGLPVMELYPLPGIVVIYGLPPARRFDPVLRGRHSRVRHRAKPGVRIGIFSGWTRGLLPIPAGMAGSGGSWRKGGDGCLLNS